MSKETVKEQINSMISVYRGFSANNDSLRGEFAYEKLIRTTALALPCERYDIKDFSDNIISCLQLFFVSNTPYQASPKLDSVKLDVCWKLDSYWKATSEGKVNRQFVYILYMLELLGKQENDEDYKMYDLMCALSFMGKIRILTNRSGITDSRDKNGQESKVTGYYENAKYILQNIKRINNAFGRVFSRCIDIYYENCALLNGKADGELIRKYFHKANGSTDEVYKYISAGRSLCENDTSSYDERRSGTIE